MRKQAGTGKDREGQGTMGNDEVCQPSALCETGNDAVRQGSMGNDGEATAGHHLITIREALHFA